MVGDGHFLDHCRIEVVLAPNKVLPRVNNKLDGQQLVATVSEGDDRCGRAEQHQCLSFIQTFVSRPSIMFSLIVNVNFYK